MNVGGLMADRVTVFDTTLRDGEQAPGFSLRVPEKLQLARLLDDLGVDVIEAGFPIASEADAEAVRMVSADLKRPVVAALARCRKEDIERAGQALQGGHRTRIHTFIATSDLHLDRKLHISREHCLEAATAAVSQARGYTDNVQFSAEDATRSDFDFLCRVVESVIKAGATTVNLPDTVGYSTPDEIYEFFHAILSRVPNSDKAIFSAHCHDDLGLAVANTLAALRAGARQVECTINGIGERAGNASLEEIVMATKVRADRLPYENGIHTEKIFATSQLLTALTGEPVQANKAIVGRNAFAHEAGIHQDGMLKDRRTYEIMRPEDVGVPATTLVLGKHSGRHAVQHRVQQLGLELSRLELDRLYRRMVALADQQKTVSDAELVQIVADLRAPEPAPSAQGTGHRHGSGTEEVGYGHGV
jgi:2-isopropylmalate synthase